MVMVKGPAGSLIAAQQQLGLTEDAIRVTYRFHHEDIKVDAWGGRFGPPPNVQFMLAEAVITANLIHFDLAILNECQRLSMGGAPAIGQLSHAGTLMGGNGIPLYSAGNNLFGVYLTGPNSSNPYHFWTCYLMEPPVIFPLGTEKSVVNCQFRAIPFTVDPWNGGLGALGSVIWDNNLND